VRRLTASHFSHSSQCFSQLMMVVSALKCGFLFCGNLGNLLASRSYRVVTTSFSAGTFNSVQSKMAPISTAIRPLVICGPSGVGKSTIVNQLLKEFPSVFGFSVSHTTRKPREGEQVNYFLPRKNRLKEAIYNVSP
jgi:hypothetical protein